MKIGDGEFVTNTHNLDAGPADRPHRSALGGGGSLFRGWPFRPVRLVGFAVDRLAAGDEGTLFSAGDEEDGRRRRLDAATDAIRSRFGEDAISQTASAFRPESTRDRARDERRVDET